MKGESAVINEQAHNETRECECWYTQSNAKVDATVMFTFGRRIYMTSITSFQPVSNRGDMLACPCLLARGYIHALHEKQHMRCEAQAGDNVQMEAAPKRSQDIC